MRILRLVCLTILINSSLDASIPADMSFIVIDLKYNKNDGVKVCEMQHGLGSTFCGVEFLEGKKYAVGTIFKNLLTSYFQRNWYVSNRITSEFRKPLDIDPRWTRISNFNAIPKNAKSKQLADIKIPNPTCLNNYYDLFICHYNEVNPETLDKIHGLVVLNRAFFPIFGSDQF